MRRNPLALLMTNGADSEGPFGTHLPVIPDPEHDIDALDDLTGATLLGHMNLGNPQWRAMRPEMPAVLSFAGPHAYVSPTVYQFTPAAPTWNFTAAQLRGIVHKIESADETLAVVQATVRAFETDFGYGWDMTDSVGYFRKILPAVGAFRFTVTRAEAMFKLSQEQKSETRERVRCHFADGESGRQRETAEYMSRIAEVNRR